MDRFAFLSSLSFLIPVNGESSSSSSVLTALLSADLPTASHTKATGTNPARNSSTNNSNGAAAAAAATANDDSSKNANISASPSATRNKNTTATKNDVSDYVLSMEEMELPKNATATTNSQNISKNSNKIRPAFFSTATCGDPTLTTVQLLSTNKSSHLANSNNDNNNIYYIQVGNCSAATGCSRSRTELYGIDMQQLKDVHVTSAVYSSNNNNSDSDKGSLKQPVSLVFQFPQSGVQFRIFCTNSAASGLEQQQLEFVFDSIRVQILAAKVIAATSPVFADDHQRALEYSVLTTPRKKSQDLEESQASSRTMDTSTTSVGTTQNTTESMSKRKYRDDDVHGADTASISVRKRRKLQQAREMIQTIRDILETKVSSGSSGASSTAIQIQQQSSLLPSASTSVLQMLQSPQEGVSKAVATPNLDIGPLLTRTARAVGKAYITQDQFQQASTSFIMAAATSQRKQQPGNNDDSDNESTTSSVMAGSSKTLLSPQDELDQFLATHFPSTNKHSTPKQQQRTDATTFTQLQQQQQLHSLLQQCKTSVQERHDLYLLPRRG